MSLSPVAVAPRDAARGPFVGDEPCDDDDFAPGWITYVGAGLGDPTLVTVAGARALERAAILAVDDPALVETLQAAGLVGRTRVQVLTLDPGADAAARAGELVQAASACHTVVRFVVGDPLGDGDRGAEASACAATGVRVEVLPGLNAVTTIPDQAGVVLPADEPVHYVDLRHGQPSAADVPPTGTVLVVGEAGQIPELARAALESGRDASEPVLVVAGGRSDTARSRTVTVGTLASGPGKSGGHLDPGERVVVGFGGAARRDPQLDSVRSRPLLGWEVLVPRTRESFSGLSARLVRHGAAVHTLDTLALEPPRNPQPMDRAIRGLVDGRYRWVVFANSVVTGIVLDTVAEYGLDARAFSGVKIAASSPLSRRILAEHGLLADVVPAHRGRAGLELIGAFPDFDAQVDPMDRILVPSAGQAPSALAEGLRRLGWRVDEVVVCRTVRAAPPPAAVRNAIKTGQFDAALFTSPGAVRNLLGLAGKPSSRTVIGAIGQATAAACLDHGMTVSVVAPAPGSRELADALADYAAGRRDHAKTGRATPAD